MRRNEKRAFSRIILLFLLASLVLSCSHRNSPSRETAAGLSFPESSIVCFEGEKKLESLTVENMGRTAWIPEGNNPCVVSYHLLDSGRNVIRYDNPRSPLPRTILSGGKETITVTIKAPLRAGTYFLEFDILREGLHWFKDLGSKTLLIPFEVKEKVRPEDGFAMDLKDGAYTKIESSVPEFNGLMKLVRITLEGNEVSFPGKTGLLQGFAAGAGYPQIWLRDAATIIAASKLYYPAPFLISWLGEHLTLQKADGGLEDWLDSKGKSDKNTVASDQETSAVLAALEIRNLLGPRQKPGDFAGVQVLERLEKALGYLLAERFDARHGLIKRGHTASWGDVEMHHADERAVDTDENTHWVADIYDQSMFYEAALGLARWFEDSGDMKKSRLWRSRAAGVKKAADKWLWLPEKGYYKIHIHLDSFEHSFDETEMFASGGNAQAVLSGLAGGPGNEKPARIVKEALLRQKAFGISTIGATILPPYPKGFFKNPALDEPFEYQNGGQWDWFGGRMVLALFESGFSLEAREKLVEIARKNLKNEGFHEWDTPDGQGRGSDSFAGSAGILTRALVEGYFGVRLTATGLELRPRLGVNDRARLHLHFPAAGSFVACAFETSEKSIRLEVNSSFDARTRVGVLLPGTRGDAKGWEEKDFEVFRDGVKIPCSLESAGNDAYAVFGIIPRDCRIEIRYLRPIE